MNEQYYIRQINNMNKQIDDLENNLKQLNQDLNNLYDFQTQHTQTLNRLVEHFDERRNRCLHTNLNKKEVQFFSQYQEYMTSILNGSQNQKILHEKEKEKNLIISKIRDVENEIEETKNEIYRLEQELSHLNYLLRKERLANE